MPDLPERETRQDSPSAETDAERRRRVDDGLSRASKFNSGAMAHAYLSVYHDIVDRRRTAA